jgi:hypothetical protein
LVKIGVDMTEDEQLIHDVAVEVMRWIKDDNCEFWREGYQNPRCENKTLSIGMTDYNSEGEIYCVPFNPLTNANHMMMVVEKLNSRYLEVRLHFTRGKKHLCDIVKEGYPVPMDSWCAMNIQMGKAVCLAAREAVRSVKA